MKTRKQRQAEVEGLARTFREVPTVVLLNMQGLTVAKDWELRRRLQQANARLRVVKNTLARLAARGTPVERLSEHFRGMTAIAFSQDDPVALVRALAEFAKENAQVQFKAALVEGTVVPAAEIPAIAALPSRTELMRQIMLLIQAPTRQVMGAIQGVTRNLVAVLGQIRDQKQQAGS